MDEWALSSSFSWILSAQRENWKCVVTQVFIPSLSSTCIGSYILWSRYSSHLVALFICGRRRKLWTNYESWTFSTRLVGSCNACLKSLSHRTRCPFLGTRFNSSRSAFCFVCCHCPCFASFSICSSFPFSPHLHLVSLSFLLLFLFRFGRNSVLFHVLLRAQVVSSLLVASTHGFSIVVVMCCLISVIILIHSKHSGLKKQKRSPILLLLHRKSNNEISSICVHLQLTNLVCCSLV